jgi:hypothetical protein
MACVGLRLLRSVRAIGVLMPAFSVESAGLSALRGAVEVSGDGAGGQRGRDEDGAGDGVSARESLFGFGRESARVAGALGEKSSGEDDGVHDVCPLVEVVKKLNRKFQARVVWSALLMFSLG